MRDKMEGPKEQRQGALLRGIGWVGCWPLIQLWGPVFLWMAGIFYFSSRPYPLGPLSRSEHREVMGTVAHFAEYLGLAALLCRALSGGWPGQQQSVAPTESGPPTGGKAFVCAFIIGLLFALSDEFHQRFVPHREAKLADVVLDAIGVVGGLIATEGWHRLFEERGKG